VNQVRLRRTWFRYIHSGLLQRALRSGDTGVVSDEALEAAARLYDEAAEELDEAGVSPAHAWAAFGDARTADAALVDQARKHAHTSNP
jgi:hypothetical protein